jgi:uncharacterized protein with ParB-like and HNH nuclease domain
MAMGAREFYSYCHDFIVKKIKDVLNQNLEIPNFQRPHSWDDGNVRQLLQDVYDSWKS